MDPVDPLDPLDPDSVSPGAEEEAEGDGAPDGAEEDAEGSADEHPARATQAATAVNRAVVRRKRWGVRDGTEDSGIGTGRAVRAGSGSGAAPVRGDATISGGERRGSAVEAY